MEELDKVWKALADPTRRAILDLLRNGPRTTTEIVQAFPKLTRFGVMKHLEVLRASGLVQTRESGRLRVNSLNAVPIRQIYERWVNRFADLWSDRLLRLKEEAEETNPQPTMRRKEMNIDTLIAQHDLGAKVCAANFAEISHEESLVPPQGGGNCANWILGHLVKARNDALALLGKTPVYPAGKFDRYKNGRPPLTDPAEALPLDELRDNFMALQEPLTAALQEADEETFARPVPDNPLNNPDETVGSMLTAIAFHEAYHLGQIGLLRRTLGKERMMP